MDSGEKIALDLKRWLPTSWPLTTTSVAQMIKVSVSALEQGMGLMRLIEKGIDKERIDDKLTALEKASARPLAEDLVELGPLQPEPGA